MIVTALQIMQANVRRNILGDLNLVPNELCVLLFELPLFVVIVTIRVTDILWTLYADEAATISLVSMAYVRQVAFGLFRNNRASRQYAIILGSFAWLLI